MSGKYPFIIIPVALVVVAGGFTLADYLQLFGSKTMERGVYVEINFRTVDDGSGAAIEDVKVNCVQRGVEHACAQRDSGRSGVVSLLVPAYKRVYKSLLFTQAEEYLQPPNEDFHVMFVHPDYGGQFRTFQLSELLNSAGKPGIVRLKHDES